MNTGPAGDRHFVARFNEVTHRYGDTIVLNAITLDLPSGSIAGVIGPDGVGKSTLLAILAGVRVVQEGRVEVLGGDITNRAFRAAVCPRIAYMPQGLGTNLYPDLSVTENIDFFGRLFGQSRSERAQRIAELLESTGLSSFPERHVRHLSGGMRQKLGLCCALVHDPDLLILDEPTTGVDPLSRRQFWELINRIRARRPAMSVHVATAYMEEAENFDWLLIMDEGRILAASTPAELKSEYGAQRLEDVYVALLPPEKRKGHQTFSIPPRRAQLDGAAIEAENLTRRFGKFVAVDHVSFRIERGEIFGFLGPNGCGKTTTMRMLTGLLPATEGTYRLFGRNVDAGSMAIRQRIGYMSQSFSLYTELTISQNLELHARLFHIPKRDRVGRVSSLLEQFGLEKYAGSNAAAVPLGVRQRLSLAVAVIHQPEILILDEPTSGVDPIARDEFWELLIDLSRTQGVTIFVSTHFMNEGSRCDRIALMNVGRVLACDAPSALVEARGKRTLEEAFIDYIELDSRRSKESTTITRDAPTKPDAAPDPYAKAGAKAVTGGGFDLRRLLAYARREGLELSRDPVRLVFSLFAPLLLLVIFGYGISLDVVNLPLAALDRDRTPESRTYLDHFSGTRYFSKRTSLDSYGDMDRRFRSGDIQIAIEIPPNFGRDLTRGGTTRVGIWIDGSNTFRAETARGYVSGAHLNYLDNLSQRTSGSVSDSLPTKIQTRFRYNQDVASAFAIVPGVIALLLALIPAILTAVGVVREKETGSIVNFYVTPVTRLEFLLGKQLPYICVSLVSFLGLVTLTIWLFGVPLKGSFVALALGAVLFVASTTGFGLLLSAFTKSQIAALFAALILTMLPSMLFSGLIRPVSSLAGASKVMGALFPTAYFNQISVGTFTKGLGLEDLVTNYVALGAFIVAFLLLSLLLLRKQES